MSDRVFFDTNVLVYAVKQGDMRSRRAEELLAQGGIISVQILSEFAAVTRRKLRMHWSEVKEALRAIRDVCFDVVPITITTHEMAMNIAERYGYRIYDSLVVAAALEARCTVLFSEDMNDGQVVDRKLTIRNPFR